MTWDRQNCEDCLLDEGCYVDGVVCGYIRTLRAKLEAIKNKLIEIRDDETWSELPEIELAEELLRVLGAS